MVEIHSILMKVYKKAIKRGKVEREVLEFMYYQQVYKTTMFLDQ